MPIVSIDSAHTEKLAEHIGRKLRGGEVIELVSDLGGGKTTFVRGLGLGAGSEDVVGSPTFTISKVYKARDLEIHHFDFYRLGEAGIVGDELAEVIDDPTIVTVVEWADIVQNVLPEQRLTITITRLAEDENARRLELRYPEALQYLLEDLPKDVDTND